MEHIGKHMSDPSKRSKRDKATERGELMKYFVEQLNPSRVKDGYSPLTIARMARLFEAMPTQDIYYLKRVCEDAKDFSKKFWWEINPKKHTPEAQAAAANKKWPKKKRPNYE